jgi:hypothetical protein
MISEKNDFWVGSSSSSNSAGQYFEVRAVGRSRRLECRGVRA